MLTRTEPTIVGPHASAALNRFLDEVGGLTPYQWWDCTPPGQVPDLDAIVKSADAKMARFASALLVLEYDLKTINAEVARGVRLVSEAVRHWTVLRSTLDVSTEDLAKLLGSRRYVSVETPEEKDRTIEVETLDCTYGGGQRFVVTTQLAPISESDPRGIIVVEHAHVLESVLKEVRELPMPVSTWALAAVDQARLGGPTRWLLRDVFWLVEGSLRVAAQDENARLAALLVHTNSVMRDYGGAMQELQRLAEEALPLDPLTEAQRDALETEGMADEEREEYLEWKRQRRAHHAHGCGSACTHRRMPHHEAMEQSQVYRDALFGAYAQAANITEQLVKSLDSYAGTMGLLAIYPHEEAGAIPAMVGNIAAALRRVIEHGFTPPREEQESDRLQMRQMDYSAANMQRRTALTVADILAGQPLAYVASDVATLVKHAPLTHRASMAHFTMERPPLALRINDLREAGVPEMDIDPMMRAMRAAVDHGRVRNEREPLLTELKSFIERERIRRTERTSTVGVSTRLRVMRPVDVGRSVVSRDMQDTSRARMLLFYVREGKHDKFVRDLAAYGEPVESEVVRPETEQLCLGVFRLLSPAGRHKLSVMIVEYDEWVKAEAARRAAEGEALSVADAQLG